MRIRVLHFDGCPNSAPAVALVRHIASLYGLEHCVDVREVRSIEDARAQRFLGSPTVQIDGVDIEPAARGRSDFGITCRLYGRAGIPPAEMLTDAIRESVDGASAACA